MLNISIVLYNTPFDQVAQLVKTLRQNALVRTISLIDNSPTRDERFATLPVRYEFNNKNIGYGAAHNRALRETLKSDTPYHLVINPDITLDSAIFDDIIAFMENNKDVGALMPKVYYPDGKLQYLCKLIPTPWNLFSRRFLPKKMTQRSKERFELRNFDYNQIAEIPYLSGCFMLLRCDTLRTTGLFDERFFMYPEDIDLTRRIIHHHWRTIFYPKVSIIHYHEQGSYKNKHLLIIHIINMIRYFNKWGWVRDTKRTAINKQTLTHLNLK
ncbi:MAG: glycosyltransferase [Paludibacteraceae bacterium]